MTDSIISEAEIYALYNQRNPRRPTNWRWQRAQRLVARGLAPNDQWDDEATRLAYFALTQPDLVSEELAGAIQIASGDHATRCKLEAFILACRSVDAAAEQVGLPPEVLALYESLFFCVLDRIGSHRYILDTAIGHRDFYEPTDVRALWAKVGFTMGPVMLKAWVDDFKSRGLADYTNIVTSARSKPNDDLGKVIDLLVRLFCMPPNTEAAFNYVATMAGVLGGHIQGEHPQQAADTNNESQIGELATTVDDVLADLPLKALEEYRARAS